MAQRGICCQTWQIVSRGSMQYTPIAQPSSRHSFYIFLQNSPIRLRQKKSRSKNSLEWVRECIFDTTQEWSTVYIIVYRWCEVTHKCKLAYPVLSLPWYLGEKGQCDDINCWIDSNFVKHRYWRSNERKKQECTDFEVSFEVKGG